MSRIAPWVHRQTLHLLSQPGHAWLLQGPTGLGQASLAMSMAQAWLCEQPTAEGLGCGVCPSCHGIAVHTHPDLMVLMPEEDMLAQDLPLDEKALREIEEKKRKPSKEIRIEAMRQAVEFSQRTSSRNHGKVVVIYPAERMNAITSNALLKTLEEPPGSVRFILASEAAHSLLPTIRSRCLTHTMVWPTHDEALQWLMQQEIHIDGKPPKTFTLPRADAEVLLQAAGGRPDDALRLAQEGIQAHEWLHFPTAARAGQTSVFAAFTPTKVIDVLQKICHDALAIKAGGKPRYFPVDVLPKAPELASWLMLTRWSKSLQQERMSSNHSYKADVFIDDLIARASMALAAPATLRRQR